MPTVRDSHLAFNEAIERGLLSSRPGAFNYAGLFMYMFTDDDGVDQFKHRVSRQYLATETEQPKRSK